MKIFRTFTILPDKAQTPLSQHAVVPLPDTVMLPPKRPFFIPDHTADCVATLCLAVRINRLGRSIARRFASRYYDPAETTLAVHFIARDVLEASRASALPWSDALAFDDAVAVAPKLPEPLQAGNEVSWQVGEQSGRADVPAALLAEVDPWIAQVSEHYTLRQGDLFLLSSPLAPQPVAIETPISVSLGDQRVFQFNLK